MQGRVRVRRRRVRMHFRFWKESRIQRHGRMSFENKSENSGISIPECQSCYRRQRDGVPAVRSPEPLGRRDLHSVSAIRPWLRRFSIWLLVTAKASLHFRMRFRPMEYPSSGAQRESSDRSAGITTTLSQLKHSNVRALKSRPTRTSIGARQFGQK